MSYFLIAAATFFLGLVLLLRWSTRWGSTAAERAGEMPGDAYLDGGRGVRVAMTRGVTIRAEPGDVWPWLAQLGRGAGWYSVDLLDNGRKPSAEHIVSWIPEPRPGDASAIGYLRHIDSGRSLVWWVNGVEFLGARARLVVDIELAPAAAGSRLVTRMSADATGLMAHPALLVFRFIDSIMAIRQLQGIRARAERFGSRTANRDAPESGSREQYQLYETIYASGETSGAPGNEHAARWRQTAIDDGVLPG